MSPPLKVQTAALIRECLADGRMSARQIAFITGHSYWGIASAGSETTETTRGDDMSGKPRNPEPVCTVGDEPEKIADAVFMKIRRLPHAPVNVYVRMGEVYVLSHAYKVTQAWDAAYPDSFAGSFTRMERPHQIVRKLERVLDEPEPEPV